MKYQSGELMGLFNAFRAFHNRWEQYCLEAACDTMLTVWAREKPEYIDNIQRWIERDKVPEDNDLQTLCKIYQERIRPRSCYRRAKTYARLRRK